MTDSIYINNAKFLHKQEGTASSAEATRIDSSEQKSPKGIDPLVLAFYYLMESTSITSQSAIIHSKQLAQNAAAQQQLDNQDAQLQWNYVPKLQSHHFTVPAGYRWRTMWVRGHHIRFKSPVYKVVVTHPNQGAVDDAEAANQQVVSDRQTISDRLNVLQQNAQAGETTVNSLTDESMQSMQEGANLLQMLKSLTFQVLLRHPPQ